MTQAASRDPERLFRTADATSLPVISTLVFYLQSTDSVPIAHDSPTGATSRCRQRLELTIVMPRRSVSRLAGAVGAGRDGAISRRHALAADTVRVRLAGYCLPPEHHAPPPPPLPEPEPPEPG